MAKSAAVSAAATITTVVAGIAAARHRHVVAPLLATIAVLVAAAVFVIAAHRLVPRAARVLGLVAALPRSRRAVAALHRALVVVSRVPTARRRRDTASRLVAHRHPAAAIAARRTRCPAALHPLRQPEPRPLALAKSNFSGIDSSIATRALTGSPASLPPTAAALLPLHVASFAW